MGNRIFTLTFLLFALFPAAAEEAQRRIDASASFPASAAENHGRIVTGTASWYGGKFQGRRTASGEIFDTRSFTAAHRFLPFGTMVKVTNLANGRSVILRINDRGPFVDNRLIDVTYAAAAELGMLSSGLARVSVEVLSLRRGAPPHVYRIQVGSFREPANADRIKARLSAEGFAVLLDQSAYGPIRVLIDNVTGDELEKTRGILRGLGFTDHIVKKVH